MIQTKDMWPPYLFAATYLAQAAVAIVAGLTLMLLKIPRPPAPTAANAGRPLSEIVRQPKFIVAVVCGIASYAMMNMVMTAAPLAMIECNHSVTDAALGLQWHVLGMFVPSFFTGALIVRFGTERVIAAGFVMLLVSAVVSISRYHALAFLGRIGAARGRLEFRLHRRDGVGDPDAPAGGA